MRIAIVSGAPIWTKAETFNGFQERYRLLYRMLDRDSDDLLTVHLRPSEQAASPLSSQYHHAFLDLPQQPEDLAPRGRRRRFVGALRDFSPFLKLAPWEVTLKAALAEWQPDVLVITAHPSWLPYRHIMQGRRTILLIEEDARREDPRWVQSRWGRSLAWFEQRAALRASSVPSVAAVISPQELEWARQLFPTTPVAVLPHALDPSYWKREPISNASSDIFVIGHMGRLRNALGLQSIAKELNSRSTDVTIRFLVASATGLHPEIDPMPANLVTMLGTVPDPRPFYYGAAATLVPAFTVSGAKTTILQAWACGCPVVSSSAAAESVGGVSGKTLLAGRTSSEVVDMLLRLVAEPDLATKLAQKGYEQFQQYHSDQALRRSWNEILELVKSAPPASR